MSTVLTSAVVLPVLTLLLILIATLLYITNASAARKDAAKVSVAVPSSSSVSRPIGVLDSSNSSSLSSSSVHPPPIVVLAGPSGSGKTSMLHALIFGRAPQTVASARATCLSMPLRDRTRVLSWKEFPDGVRGPFFAAAATARALLIVVDAAGDAKHIAAAGSMLYTALTLDKVVSSGVKMLIIAARADVAGARAPAVLRAALGAELDCLRDSHAAVTSLASVIDEKTVPLGGVSGRPFNFDTDSPIQITYAAASLKQLASVNDFIIATCET